MWRLDHVRCFVYHDWLCSRIVHVKIVMEDTTHSLPRLEMDSQSWVPYIQSPTSLWDLLSATSLQSAGRPEGKGKKSTGMKGKKGKKANKTDRYSYHAQAGAPNSNYLPKSKDVGAPVYSDGLAGCVGR